MKNILRFQHFHHKCGNPFRNTVRCTNTGVDAVHNWNHSGVAGNETSNLSEDHIQCNLNKLRCLPASGYAEQIYLSNIGTFSTHIWPSNNMKRGFSMLKINGIWDENTAHKRFHTRVATFFQINDSRVYKMQKLSYAKLFARKTTLWKDFGPYVWNIRVRSNLCQCNKNIQRCKNFVQV